MSIRSNPIVALWNQSWFFRLNLALAVVGMYYLLA